MQEVEKPMGASPRTMTQRDEPILPDEFDYEPEEPIERFGVQLAAFRKQAEAESGWHALMERYADLLGFLDPRIVEVAPYLASFVSDEQFDFGFDPILVALERAIET